MVAATAANTELGVSEAPLPSHIRELPDRGCSSAWEEKPELGGALSSSHTPKPL